MNYATPLPTNPLARLLAGVNRGVMHVVAAVAAALVVVETGVLLAGVICRYALHDPLIWSDELASTLFIWLSILRVWGCLAALVVAAVPWISIGFLT